MTMKTHDIDGLGKHVDDSFVIPEEEYTIGSCSKKNKSQDDIQKGMSH